MNVLSSRRVNAGSNRGAYYVIGKKTVKGGCDRYNNRFGVCSFAHVSCLRAFRDETGCVDFEFGCYHRQEK